MNKPVSFADIEARRLRYEAEKAIRHDERKRLLAYLTRSARAPGRIGKRVILLEFLLRDGEEDREKCKVLAERLGVSQARVSAGLTAAQAETESWNS